MSFAQYCCWVIALLAKRGICFSPANVCNPLDPDNLMKCNGRGILIQRALMDEVIFRAGPGGGTEVELIKRRGKAGGKGKK